MLMRHYVIFRSPCRIQNPSRLVVQGVEKEVLIAVESPAIHCCAIKKNDIELHHSYTMLPMYSSRYCAPV